MVLLFLWAAERTHPSKFLEKFTSCRMVADVDLLNASHFCVDVPELTFLASPVMFPTALYHSHPFAGM